MADKLKTLFGGRALRLALSLILLSLSMLLAAEMLGLRNDQSDTLKDARKLVAETLAVQLSLLAQNADTAKIDLSIASLVERNADVMAAALTRESGESVSVHGSERLLDPQSSLSTLHRLSVPIYDEHDLWGTVQVAFDPKAAWRLDLWYYVFVLGGSMAAFTLFLGRVLIQLNPNQAVPERVNSAFNMFSEGVIILDDSLRIVLANDACNEITAFGTADTDLTGKTLDEWPWVRDQGWQPPWVTTLNTGMKIVDKPLRLTVSGELERLLLVSCSLVGNQEADKHGVLVTLNDMTAIERKNHDLADTLRKLREANDSITAKNVELETLATRDPLTGIANRRFLMETFDKAIDGARTHQRELACMIVDIDHFKQINDTYGHSIGDEVICAVSNTLVSHCGEYGLVGRYGGEEFVVILSEIDDEEPIAIAESVRMAVAALGDNDMLAISQLSVSVGLSSFDEKIQTATEFIDRADLALYAAKSHGRNQVVIWSEALETEAETNKTSTHDTADIAVQENSSTRILELEAIVEHRNRELSRLKDFDALTGIPKRTLFLQRVEAEIQRADRLDSSVGVLSLEIRDMQRYISSFGYEQCDALILSVVTRLQDGLRRTDIVAELTAQHSLSRITSSEYGLLLADLSSSAQAMPVVTRLRRMLADPFLIGDSKVYIGASMGIAMYPQSGETAAGLLDNAARVRAEAALKPEKISHAFASESLDQHSRNYIKLESDLFDAVQNRDLFVNYQPRIDLHGQQVGGIEVLARWQHPTRGAVSPDEFISIAESNGLVHDISSQVLEQSLTALHKWLDLGWRDLKLSINLSAVQLGDRDINERFLDPIRDAGIPYRNIEVELTETSFIDNRFRAENVLRQFRELGISVSMDDFGTGYTSLALLSELPLDCVKIDRSFVVDMTRDARHAAIVESVIAMAHSLSLSVVGEGVETNEQLMMLEQIGCDEVQGYLTGKPMSEEDMTRFLAEQTPTRQRRAG